MLAKLLIGNPGFTLSVFGKRQSVDEDGFSMMELDVIGRGIL
ncbi:MAG: hypothetical protein QF877_08715 [Gammaproteobacteria bacterium]|nr:hypothetical protein [Gammaproteobacteria bacterium]